MERYKIVRDYSRTVGGNFETKSRALAGYSGLTLEDAQAHCRRDDTHRIRGHERRGTGRAVRGGWNYFDGYTVES